MAGSAPPMVSTATCAGIPMFWLADWIWSVPLIVLTVLVHSFTLFAMHHRLVAVLAAYSKHGALRVLFGAIMGATVLLLTALHTVEAAAWAVVYVMLRALPEFRSALLYSLGSMTTYGHVDIVLEPHWQVMGALEALNGLMLFGLTTAFLVSVVSGALSVGEKRRH